MDETRKIIEDYCRARQSQEQLDKRLYPYNWQAEIKSRKAPILHFGLVIQDKDVEYCIEKNNITIFRGTPLAEREPHGMHRLLAVMDFLRDKHEIRTRNELVLGEGVFEILALYNNYDEPLYQFVEEDEQEMLAIIRDELGLKDQKAKWWWDGWWGTTYSCEIEQYNPPGYRWSYEFPSMCPVMDAEKVVAKLYPSLATTSV